MSAERTPKRRRRIGYQGKRLTPSSSGTPNLDAAARGRAGAQKKGNSSPWEGTDTGVIALIAMLTRRRK